MEKHPGFKKVQASIAKRSGVSSERAGAILGAATRRASPAAKRANPRLKRVKGTNKGGDVHMESPYCVEGGSIRTSIGVAMPSLDPRIPSPVPYANPAQSITEEGPRGDAKHVKL